VTRRWLALMAAAFLVGILVPPYTGALLDLAPGVTP
jgi:hypothetical protein